MHISDNQKKLFIIFILGIYCLLGMLLIFLGNNSSAQERSTGDSVVLTPDRVLAQKILGNDHCIKNISFEISTNKISKSAQLSIYLLQGGYDLESNLIKDKISFQGDELQKLTEISVAFPHSKLIYNRDYYIAFYLRDIDNPDAAISFITNSYGYGLYSEGADYGISLAYDIDYYTVNTKIFFAWKILFIFGITAVALCFIKKIPFWNASAIVCLAFAFGIYISGLLNVLKLGYFFIIICTCVAFLMLVRFLIRYKWSEIRCIWSNYVWKGFICWSVILIFYFFIDIDKIVQYWDEFVHWAVAAKDMYLFDSFPMHANTAVTLVRYPTMYTGFQYLLLQIYGGYSEGILHFAKHMLIIVFLMSCLESEKKQRWPILFIAIVCIGLPELFFPRKLMSSILNDEIIGCTFAYMIVQLKKIIEEFSYSYIFTFISGTLFCILSKDTGLICAIILLCTIVCMVVYIFWRDHVWSKTWIISSVALLITIVLGETSWQMYLKLKENAITPLVSINATEKSLNTVAATGLGKNQVVEFITGKAEAYKYEVFPTYLKKIFFSGDYPNIFFAVSFLGWFLIICILLFVFLRLKKEKMTWLIFILIMGGGTIAAYELLYTFTFPASDVDTFVSLERYLAAHLLAISVLVICIIQDLFEEGKRYGIFLSGIGLCVSILVLTGFCSNHQSWLRKNKVIDGEIDESTIAKGELLRKWLTEGDTLYHIAKVNSGPRYMCTRYYCMPIAFNSRVNGGRKTYYPVTGETREADYQVSVNDWEEVLENYDYLFIDECDSKFTDSYGELFEDVDKIDNGGLYKIDNESSRLLHYCTTISPIE